MFDSSNKNKKSHHGHHSIINISELTKHFFPCYPKRHYTNETAANILESLPESVTDFIFKLCEGYDDMRNSMSDAPPIFAVGETHRDIILNNPIIGTIFNERYFPLFNFNQRTDTELRINTKTTEHEGHD